MNSKLFFFSTLLLFNSCNDKKLTEVTVPLPETNSESVSIGNPDDIVINKGVFEIVKLPVKYDAFEPEISANCLKLHYSKIFVYHANNFNKIATQFKIEKKPIEEIVSVLDISNPQLRNSAGGYFNHKLYFEQLTKKKIDLLEGDLKTAIITDFESFTNFKNQFLAAANGQFGSGWVWLILDRDKKLQIITTQNEDNPMMSNSQIKGTPLIGLDLWEHSYINENQITKSNYIDTFFNSVNWNIIMRRYQTAIK